LHQEATVAAPVLEPTKLSLVILGLPAQQPGNLTEAQGYLGLGRVFAQSRRDPEVLAA
jgi:hypothetical protein